MRQTRQPQTRLDPRDPLVIDTRELGRRAGSMRRLHRTFPAPAGLTLELAGVPAGSDLTVELRLEAVTEGVLVSGSATATATGECGRCLAPIGMPVEAELVELYAYPGDERADGVDEDEVGRLDGDFIAFEPRLRDAVLLALPLRPVCRDDCPGLCATCGVRLADVPLDHGHEDDADPRWTALRGLVTDGGNEANQQVDEAVDTAETTDEER